MKMRVLLGTAAALTLAGATTAAADETRVERSERSHTCVCTGEPHVAPTPPVPPIPPIPPGARWHMELQDSDDRNVYTFRQGDGDDEQVIIIRRARRHDSADANKDGVVTRREFVKRAEKQFKERDKNHNGKLEGEELARRTIEVPFPPAPPAPHDD